VCVFAWAMSPDLNKWLNTPVPSVNYCDGLDRCILYCILFVFMLALLCFCVATEFSVNKDLYISVIIRPPRNASIRCGVLLSFGGLYVCLSVCWSQPWAVQKRIDRSRCRLGYELRWDQEPCNRWGSGSPEKGTISAEGTSPDPLYSIRCSSFLKTMSQYRWIYHCRTLPLWQPIFFSYRLWTTI